MKDKLTKRLASNAGLMGTTHALSAVSLFLVFVSLFPGLIFKYIPEGNLVVLIASTIVVAGAALLPDLDSPKSTVISALGIIGVGISKMMRAFSTWIMKTVRSPQDDPTPDPHRGFWHTFVSGIIIWSLTLFTVTSHPAISFTEFSLSRLFSFLWLFVCTHIAIAAIFSKFARKKRKSVIGHLSVLLMSVLIAGGLMTAAAQFQASFSWIGFAVFFGYIAHLLGDIFTASGAPVLWPIKIKGKRWWKIRLAKIRVAGKLEKSFLIPVFMILSIAGIAKIFLEVIK